MTSRTIKVTVPGAAGAWMRVDPLELVETYTERTGIAEYESGLSRTRAEKAALLYIDEHYLVLKREPVPSSLEGRHE